VAHAGRTGGLAAAARAGGDRRVRAERGAARGPRLAAIGRVGPECLEFDERGRLYSGYVDGTIVPGADVYAPIATAREHAGWLYFGSLSEGSIGRYRLPASR
jgi:hypothetical protein